MTISITSIRLFWDGDSVCALAGPDLQGGIGGFGDSAAEALADLVKNVQEKAITLEVPK